jgi:hypothetical protein
VSRARVVACWVGVASLLAVLPAAAASAHAQRFEKATAALERGAFGEAIGEFEALADGGFVHPNASYNRGLAYVGRARSLQAEPGDLGRAAAALWETALLRGGDEEAEQALELVRSEIARRLARRGRAPVTARASLGRAVVMLASEDVWAAIAALGSAAAAVGLALRRFSAQYSARLAGSIALGVGLLLLVVGAALLAGAGHLRRTTKPAVVVVEQARLLDEHGRPVAAARGEGEADTVPEGAEVYVAERRGGLSRIVWGSAEGWLIAGQLRELETVPERSSGALPPPR